MYKIDELIREGIHIIDDYKKVQHTEKWIVQLGHH